MAQKIKELEIQLAKTGMTSFEVDKSTASTVFQHFMRGYLARPDLAGSIFTSQKNNFSLDLEQVRNFLSKNSPLEAMHLLSTLTPRSRFEEAEFNLEFSRCLFFNSAFTETIEHIDLILKNEETSPVTLMTAHQLRGRSLHMLGQMQAAEESLLKAYSLAMVFPYANSGFVAKAYLVHLYAELKRQDDAEKFLAIMDLELTALTNTDVWISRKLIYLRALSHALRHFKSSEELKHTLSLAYDIAKVLGDNYFTNKCSEELLTLNEIKSPPTSHQFKGWIYFPQLKCVVKLFPREIIRLEKNQIMIDILNQLVTGPKSQSELFESVWKIPFHARHSGHLRANLSKLRKKLPRSALTVSGSIVSLV